MREAMRLDLGVVAGHDIYDEVLKETLSHQGVLFEEVSGNLTDLEKFPCVLLSKYSEERYEIARKHCMDEKGIIIAESEIPLDFLLEALSGQLAAPSADSIDPLMNQYETTLLRNVRERYASQGFPLIRKWFWPQYQNGCLVMTHDVDWLNYSPWHRVVLRKKSPVQLVKLAYHSFFHRRNYGYNISEMIEKESKAKIKSSFFLLPNYPDRDHWRFLETIKQLSEKSFDIGLHSYYAHENSDRLKKQKMQLESYTRSEIRGTRQHELNFAIPFTWRYEEQAGLIYDLTFYYNDKFGFRSSLCFPYHPIDRHQDTRFSILEMPTSFMDWTVLFRKMNYEEALKMFFAIDTVVEKYNGLLLTCFHNTYQNKEAFPEIEQLYSTILDSSVKKNYWITTATECCLWWLEREKAKISATIKDDHIIGKADTHPIPLIIENEGEETKREEIRTGFFSIEC